MKGLRHTYACIHSPSNRSSKLHNHLCLCWEWDIQTLEFNKEIIFNFKNPLNVMGVSTSEYHIKISYFRSQRFREPRTKKVRNAIITIAFLTC